MSRKEIPLKPATVRKRRNVAFRTRDAMRERLQAAADANQRSVSEEIEHRLEQSFLHEDVRETIREEMRQAVIIPKMPELTEEQLREIKSPGRIQIMPCDDYTIHPQAMLSNVHVYNLEFPPHSHAGINQNGDISGTVSLKRVR